MQDKNLELSARDKVVQKMSRDGAVENNISAASSHRISNRTLDATLQAEHKADLELGGRARHDANIRHSKNRRIYGMPKSSEEDRLDALLSQVTNGGMRDTAEAAQIPENYQTPDIYDEVDIYEDSSNYLMDDTSQVTYATNVPSETSIAFSEKRGAFQTASDAKYKIDTAKRLQKRRARLKYHEGQMQNSDKGASDSESPILSALHFEKEEAGSLDMVDVAENIGNKQKEAAKKVKKKNARLHFDDEIKTGGTDISDNQKYGRQKGKGRADTNALPFLYETANAARSVVKSAVHASDISEETDDNTSSDALSVGEGTAILVAG